MGGISSILNVTTYESLGVDIGLRKLFLYARDEENENISALFASACDFINGANEAGERVMVHCMAGRSRSASLVIAYLMRFHDMSLADAFYLVKRRRPIILPNIGFWEQLAAEELRLFGVASQTPANYTQLLEIRRTISPSLLFQRYATAFFLEDAAARSVAVEIALADWPEGWPAARSVEEILLASLEHLHNNARCAAVSLIADLLQIGRFTRLEVRDGFDMFRKTNLDDLRLDIPKVDDYVAAIVLEAHAKHILGDDS